MDEIYTESKMIVETNEMENMYLLFHVEDDIYGIEVKYVLQIVAMQQINKMPEMPHDMKGYINLRGSVIPVVSMRLHFGMMEDEYTERTCIIVVTVGEKEIGLIVDAIQEAITIDPDSISPTPHTSTAADDFYVKGIARLSGGDTAVLLHVPGLFQNSDFQDQTYDTNFEEMN